MLYCSQKVEKKHLKKLHTYGSWEFFFSAALTAQNSPELHFRFINSFIQPSLLKSLFVTEAIQARIERHMSIFYASDGMCCLLEGIPIEKTLPNVNFPILHPEIYTVFPHIVSSLEYFPPLNSFLATVRKLFKFLLHKGKINE